MLIRRPSDIAPSEITPRDVYLRRREFLAGAAALGVVSGLSALFPAKAHAAPLTAAPSPLSTTDEEKTTLANITTYNNFYEFGTDKGAPARNAHTLKTTPWKVKVDGMVNKPGDYGIEDLINFNALEERVYRHRCVERWSVVIPWIGVSLSDVLKKVDPQPSAKFVEFTTLQRPSEMPGQRTGVLEWPYVEGLRMDEAMHPLTMMVVGLYGKVLPNQNGAPLRVHIPWKYGFKSGKSIVRIRFTDKMPATTWAIQSPDEYGFYANVNPSVPHPRWSQARERRLPNFLANTPTLLFNGYGDQVASLYTGMDLKKYY